MFDINEGDTLMVMGDINHGIALIKADKVYDFLGGVMPNERN